MASQLLNSRDYPQSNLPRRINLSEIKTEITKLKKLYLKTPLEKDRTIIVAPSEFMTLARQIAVAVDEQAGEKLEVIDSIAAGEEILRQLNVILVGNSLRNGLTYELYRQRYTFVDGYLPGKGRYHVHTVHNPYATGTNAIIVAGSDSKGTARAVEKLFSIIHGLDRGKTALPRINETDSNHRPFFDFNGDVSNAANIGQPMAAYFFTNDHRQGEIARTALYARMKDIYANCNGHDFFFRGKIMLLFWDLIEEGDIFTDDDRLAITNMLLTLTRHASQEHHGWHGHEPCPEGRLMQNHASHAALTFLWGARYFKKYYGYTEFDDLLSCVDNFFEMCFRSSANLDDCGGYYYWPGVGHCLGYDAYSGKKRMIKTGFLKECSQKAVAVLDNLRHECGYGECEYGGRPLFSNALRFGARFLQDAQLKWLEHWLNEPELWANAGKNGAELPPGWIMMVTDGLYASDIEPEPPERYCGILVIPLPEYFAKVQCGKPNLPYFDKITFRDKFDREAEYLCLDGYWAKNPGVHRDADSNAILGLTWKGCNFLVDSRHDGSIYFRAIPPSMHNCAVVKKIDETNAPEEFAPDTTEVPLTAEESEDGFTNVNHAALREMPFQTDIPPLATLEALGNFKRCGIVWSRLADYGGMDWMRNILWMRGRFFVIVDDFVAQADGLFEVSLHWQTLGDVSLDGNCFSVSQELDEPVLHPDDSTLRKHSIATLHIQNTGGVTSSIYPDYGYGRFASYGHQRVIVLKQTRRAKLKADERIRIANLLYATSNKDSSKDTVMAIEETDGVISVKEGTLSPGAHQPKFVHTVTLGVTDVPLEADGLKLNNGAFIREGTYIAVAGASQASFQGETIIDSDEPTATEITRYMR